jgi:pimeloyl-ACP methyl ester carboxylesterase
MPALMTNGISLFYEVYGDAANPPLMLLTGLGGVGAAWGAQIGRFAADYFVIVPDHRGTGRSTHTLEGHSTAQLAADMASLLAHLGVGPAHVVGASTGGAIAQYMALDHPEAVRTLTLSSTWARFDAFTRAEFQARRKMAAEWSRAELYPAYALFLFSPRFWRENTQSVQAWVDRAVNHPEQPGDREIALARIDMIMAHDTHARLGEIRHPTLVICADLNLCTPLPLSEELAQGVSDAELVVIRDAGELVDIERPDEFFRIVGTFIGRR